MMPPCSSAPPPRLLYIVNDASYFISHRLPIALAAREAGYEVSVASIEGNAADHIRSLGFEFFTLPLPRGSINPVRELRALWSIFILLRRLKPSLVHAVTTKPVLYGSLAARAAGVPSLVAAVAGLGPVFTDTSFKFRIIRFLVARLYRLALAHPNNAVIFQNSSDRSTLASIAALRPEQSVLVPGSGVDLNQFRPLPEPTGRPIVLMAARLVKSKGPDVFVEAARIIRSRGVDAEFWLAGEPDTGSRGAIDAETLDLWRDEGIVRVLGRRTDMQDLLNQASIVVLPSTYGEGLPRVLVEAAACGRPVVTTDHPGCRDAIVSEVTGLLVPPNDPSALADAIENLVGNPRLRQNMGQAAREMAMRTFAIESIVAAHMNVYCALDRPTSTKPRSVSS